MKKKNNLYVMVGPPAAGKSTLARTDFPDSIYVSRDEVRFSMIKEGEEYFSKEKQVYMEFILRIQEALSTGKDVVADATHLNKASRAKLLNALILTDVRVVAVFIKPTLEVCLERNLKREGRERVPEDAIKNMHRFCGKPTKEEGFDLIIDWRDK